jgi:hypothetical protein
MACPYKQNRISCVVSGDNFRRIAWNSTEGIDKVAQFRLCRLVCAALLLWRIPVQGYDDTEVLQAALTVINDPLGHPDYARALDLLKTFIRLVPNADNIDYYYAWAAFCQAKLGNYDDCLEYYKRMRMQFYGTQTKGMYRGNCAVRDWNGHLEIIKGICRKDPRASPIVRRMSAIDDEAKANFLDHPPPHVPPGDLVTTATRDARGNGSSR